VTLITSDGLVQPPRDAQAAEAALATPIATDETDRRTEATVRISDSSTTAARTPSWTSRYVASLVGADLAAALMAALVCWLVRPSADDAGVTVLAWHADYWLLAVVLTPIWLGALALGGSYRRRHASQGLSDYRMPVVTALQLAGAACIVSFALQISLSRLLVVVYFPVLLIASLLLRCGCRQVLSAMRRRGHGMRRMLLVGDEACVARFANHLLRSPTREYQLVGACIPIDKSWVTSVSSRLAVVGRPDDVVAVAEDRDVDTVLVVGNPNLEKVNLQEIAWRIERSGRNLLVGPDVVDLAGPRISVAAIGGLPLLHIGDPMIGVHRHTIKACYERALALLMFVGLAPVLAVVAIAILVDSGRPVFYRQQRVGFKGRVFRIVKFRTMDRDADSKQEGLRESNDHDGALFKMRTDPRVTRVGRWLRRSSLDELPQLLNVVRGDMVLIGPRPCLPSEATKFGVAAQRRFLARPGLTGLWQVSGRSDIPWAEAIRLDLYYVENWSPWMDLMIAWRTIKVVLTGSGGY
jgi:exopolysaccharide biosynthesis polyprenyl glycosylphosphotransferase